MTAPDELDLRRLLAARADGADPPAAPIDRLLAAGARAQRRRRFGAVATGVGVAASVALLAGVLTGGLGGLGGRDAVPPADGPVGTSTESPILLVDGEQLFTCGDSGAFAGSAMTSPRGEHPRAREIDRAVAGALDDDQGWRVLQESGDRIDVATGAWDEAGPRYGGLVVHLTSTTERLNVTGISDCDLQPALADPDAGWARVELVEEPDPATETLAVSVSEIFCAAGRDPGPHLREPYVEESDTTVTVYWPSTRPSDPECHQSGANPSVVRTVSLTAPLGDRQVLDGSVWPPRPIRR